MLIYFWRSGYSYMFIYRMCDMYDVTRHFFFAYFFVNFVIKVTLLKIIYIFINLHCIIFIFSKKTTAITRRDKFHICFQKICFLLLLFFVMKDTQYFKKIIMKTKYYTFSNSFFNLKLLYKFKQKKKHKTTHLRVIFLQNV